ncbi:tigger transposable element-derived protein 4-like [Mercenaria mercenaria]|uniref:tigger transposable element-derived protein 4-like n=1 Tax=Mercenaria mercenaria TaxID=6596 RepID=UPI00234E9CB5|nr:tigger transposable element-derived protein 4-like [Mercenaria mercenaria]
MPRRESKPKKIDSFSRCKHIRIRKAVTTCPRQMKKPRCFKHVQTLPTKYMANKKAWMSANLFKTLVKTLDDRMDRCGRKIALVIDNCPAHPEISSLKAIKLVFLPPRTTSVTQPMVQGVIKNLKVHYRRQVLSKKIKAIGKTEFAINVLDALRMMRRAWSQIKPSTIANCY